MTDLEAYVNALTFAFMHHPGLHALFAYFLACHPYTFYIFNVYFLVLAMFAVPLVNILFPSYSITTPTEYHPSFFSIFIAL